MVRPRHDPPIKRINTQVYSEDHAWLLNEYGSQNVAATIRDLIREHRRRVETQHAARAARMELQK